MLGKTTSVENKKGELKLNEVSEYSEISANEKENLIKNYLEYHQELTIDDIALVEQDVIGKEGVNYTYTKMWFVVEKEIK